MSDIVRTGKVDAAEADTGWGDDIFSLITAKSSGDAAMIRAAEGAIQVRYRKELRPRFETDPNVRESISNDRPAAECRQRVLDAVKDVCRQGTEEIFERVVDELLLEIDQFRKLPASMYLIDESGQVVMPIGEAAIYKPPDFIGEDGKVRKAKPIVHPGVSSGLAMKRQDEYRFATALAKASATPLGVLALKHDLDPASMRGIAVEWLGANGVVVKELPPEAGSSVTIEFGREQYDGIFQAPNYSFHRFRMFGELLGRKVLEAMGGPGACDLGHPVLESNSKQRWYKVSFRHIPL